MERGTWLLDRAAVLFFLVEKLLIIIKSNNLKIIIMPFRNLASFWDTLWPVGYKLLTDTNKTCSSSCP